MKKITVFALVAMMAAVAGCATRPISTSQANLVPDKRILDKQLTTLKSNTVEVVVKRDSGMMGSLCNTKIFINGSPSAELAPSEKVTFYLPEGSHIIGAWPNNPCGGAMSEVEARVIKGRPLAFRVGYGTNGDYFINPTAF